jgi:hypothetical protein
MKLNRIAGGIFILGLLIIMVLSIRSKNNLPFKSLWGQLPNPAGSEKSEEEKVLTPNDSPIYAIASMFSGNLPAPASAPAVQRESKFLADPITTSDIKYIGMVRENGEPWYYFRDILRGKLYKLRLNNNDNNIFLKYLSDSNFILTIEGAEYHVK